MAKSMPPIHSRFKPGQSGNPAGKPKGAIRRDEIEATLGKFCRLTREQLQDVVKNPKSTMLEVMVASIMAQTAQKGDASRLEFVLQRMIGKVKDELEIVAPKPYVVTRSDGSQIEMGAALPAIESE